ncbi:MAG: hypothetical protein JWM19_3935 [Actinomycetia bacterium]|nr:hypothetical protein [Actinomycetes bacterium]
MISTQFRPTTTDAGTARARELLHAAHATADQLGARHLRPNFTIALPSSATHHAATHTRAA